MLHSGSLILMSMIDNRLIYIVRIKYLLVFITTLLFYTYSVCQTRTANQLISNCDILINTGRTNAALICFLEISKGNKIENENLTDIDIKISKCYLQLQQLDLAKRYIDNAFKNKNWTKQQDLAAKLQLALYFKQVGQVDTCKTLLLNNLKRASKFFDFNYAHELHKIYLQQGNQKEALKFAKEVIKISVLNSNYEGIIMGYLDLANCYKAAKDYYFSIGLCSKADSIIVVSKKEHLLGQVYELKGNNYIELHEPDSAIYYHKMIVENGYKFNNIRYIAWGNLHLANDYQLSTNDKLAFKHYNIAEPYFLESKNPREIATFYLYKGSFLAGNGFHQQAIKLFKISEKFGTQINEKFILLNIYDQLSQSYTKINDYKNALKYIQLKILIESNINEEKFKSDLEVLKKELVFKEKENKLLLEVNKQSNILIAQKNNILVLLFLLIITLVVTIYLVYQQYKIHKKSLIIQSNLLFQNELISELESFNYFVAHDLKKPFFHLNHFIEKLNPLENDKLLNSSNLKKTK